MAPPGAGGHPPYAWLEAGEPRGLYVDAIRLALQRAGVQQPVRWVMEPWKRALRSAEAGRAHLLFPPARYPGERPYLAAFSPPLFDTQPVVVCSLAALQRRERRRWPEDFLDLRFGVVDGVLFGGARWRALLARGLLRTEAVAGVQTNVRKLSAGRLDCVLASRHAVAWALAQDKATGDSLRVAVRLPPSIGHLAYVAHPREPLQALAPDFAQRLDAALLQLRRDGELQRLLERHRCDGGPADWAGVIDAPADTGWRGG